MTWYFCIQLMQEWCNFYVCKYERITILIHYMKLIILFHLRSISKYCSYDIIEKCCYDTSCFWGFKVFNKLSIAIITTVLILCRYVYDFEILCRSTRLSVKSAGFCNFSLTFLYIRSKKPFQHFTCDADGYVKYIRFIIYKLD